MLFDLRGRGRRRTVQVIYLGLAVLMGGGLVLFGIGGATNGGLFDAFKNDAGQHQGDNRLQDEVDRARAATRTAQTNPAAWARLAKAEYQVAGIGDGYDQATGTFTDKGKQKLRSAANAWERCLTLTKTPDPALASRMVQVYGAAGLNDPKKAVAAQELVVDDRVEKGAAKTTQSNL